MSEIKGSKLSSKIEFVRRVHGDEAAAQVIDALPAGERELVRDVVDLRWYPAEMYDHLVEAICRVVANGDETIYERMGAATADHQLNNIYAAFKKNDLLRMIKNMVPMHSHMNRPAHMEVDVANPNEWFIVVREPKSSLTACRIARAFYRRAAEIAGAGTVDVTETTCSGRGDEACRFRVQWTGQP